MRMIERVARAIWGDTLYEIASETREAAEAEQAADARNGHFDYGPYHSREAMHEQARAAIEAMADPTETMITAMREADTFNYPESAWPAAIDAALQEKQG